MLHALLTKSSQQRSCPRWPSCVRENVMTDAITRRRPTSDAPGPDPWTAPFEPALPLAPASGNRVVCRLRAIRRMGLSCLWTLVASVPQRLLLRRKSAAKIVFARFYWASICRILGLKVHVIGDVAGTIRDNVAVKNGERPIIFVANHSSWLDIAVAGGILPTVFVAKQQIADWPVIGTLARLGRTIFVSRQRNNTGRELQAMTDRLNDGDNLILFPEAPRPMAHMCCRSCPHSSPSPSQAGSTTPSRRPLPS